jgi:hypothetical protein
MYMTALFVKGDYGATKVGGFDVLHAAVAGINSAISPTVRKQVFMFVSQSHSWEKTVSGFLSVSIWKVVTGIVIGQRQRAARRTQPPEVVG